MIRRVSTWTKLEAISICRDTLQVFSEIDPLVGFYNILSPLKFTYLKMSNMNLTSDVKGSLY